MITLEEMKSAKSVLAAIEMAESHQLPYPEAVKMPRLVDSKNIEQVKAHVVALESYQVEKQKFDEERKAYRTRQGEINSLIEDYIKDASGLNQIPEQYRDKVFSKAYGYGHLDGYCEVYLKLINLVEIFN